MSDGFYPVPELEGPLPTGGGSAAHAPTRGRGRLGLMAGALALAFGIGALGAGQLTTAGHEPGGGVTTTKSSDPDTAPAQQPAGDHRVPAAGEERDED
jgi:hypothetical protein